MASRDSNGGIERKILKLLLPDLREDDAREQQRGSAHSHSKPKMDLTPLCNAVFCEDPLLFDEVLKQTNTLKTQPLSSQEVRSYVGVVELGWLMAQASVFDAAFSDLFEFTTHLFFISPAVRL